MDKLKKLAEYLGYNVHIINDIVYIKTMLGYEMYEPCTKHAFKIEEKFQLTTEYKKDNWIVAGKLCRYAAPTAAQARLNAALSYME